jgi:hypothetical protein
VRIAAPREGDWVAWARFDCEKSLPNSFGGSELSMSQSFSEGGDGCGGAKFFSCRCVAGVTLVVQSFASLSAGRRVFELGAILTIMVLKKARLF